MEDVLLLLAGFLLLSYFFRVMEALKKELLARARVLSVYNKREDEFETKREYDDYLEEREDVIFRLTEGEDLAATEAQIAEYKRNNQRSINENRIREMEEKRAGLELDETFTPAALLGTANGNAAGKNDMLYTPVANAQGFGLVGGLGGPQPVPVKEVELKPDGSFKGYGALPSNSEEWNRMAKLSGWSRDFYKNCALKHAFTTVFS
ncbi:hypothetical protein BSKO_04073 [Bryopsis sp. KO-2023]|nr:hypothetical protein BSKO_04073 [Bryopsis sp. KO-2023]